MKEMIVEIEIVKIKAKKHKTYKLKP